MGRNYDYEEAEERAFCQQLTKWSTAVGVEQFTIKLNLKGRRGWPDRLVIWEGGNLLFIEFKRKGEEPRKLQLLIHETLRKLGFDVQVFDDKHEALSYVQAQIRATALAARGDEVGGGKERIPLVLEAGAWKDGGHS